MELTLIVGSFTVGPWTLIPAKTALLSCLKMRLGPADKSVFGD